MAVQVRVLLLPPIGGNMIDYGFIFIFANHMMFMPIHVQEDIFNYIKNDDLSFDNTFIPCLVTAFISSGVISVKFSYILRLESI